MTEQHPLRTCDCGPHGQCRCPPRVWEPQYSPGFLDRIAAEWSEAFPAPEKKDQAPMPKTWEDTPLTRCASAALPLLIEADARLYATAAPRAGRLSTRINIALVELLTLASEVQAYYNGDELAGRLGDATKEYDDIERGAA